MVETDYEGELSSTPEDLTALRHALDRWPSTFGNAAVATLIVDRHGVILDANRAFAELVGVDLQSTLGRSTIDFVHPDHHEDIRERMRLANRGEPVTLTMELRLLRADGTTIVAVLHPSTITPGQQTGAVVQLVDITSQRRAEARLALHRDLLELVTAGTPLRDVATAVEMAVPSAIDGATGAVVLDAAPSCSDRTTAMRTWRVPIDRARPHLGALLITGPRRQRDDDDAAAMLASVVKLAVQRDELAGEVPRHRRRTKPSLPLPSPDERAANDLRRGLDAGEISVHYQPVIDLRSGTTVSLEALVRWQHPTRGFVPPPELIEVAEQCGLIKHVGALVLTTACRDLAAWRHAAAGRDDLSVAVNLSAMQLTDPDLVELVERAIASTDLDASALILEITESVVVDEVDLVAASLGELRARGARVAIDDFGTGYSSLLYLKRFPADVLKVDRSFVSGLGLHDDDTAIVEAVVNLGHRLGLEVVAEGIETGEQLLELRRRQCDQAQGFLLQRPVPATEVGQFLDLRALDLGPDPT